MNFMFEVFPVIFFITFFLILGVFIFTFIKGISEWHKNNNSPRLCVSAAAVTKRTSHSSHRSTNGHRHHSTSHYVTFEFESGDRLELHVSGAQYGMIAQGDVGRLCFQGTRFLSFERDIQV